MTLVTGRGGRLPQTLADRLQAASEHIAGVALHINSEPGNAIFAAPEGEVPRFKRLAGTPVLEEELAGVRLQVGPGDFFQTNPGVANQIASDLLEHLAPHRDRPVLDLYCGVGGFTLALAKAHGWAYGAEVVEGAIARARENARLNHIPAEFGVGRVADIVPELAKRTEGQGPVVVVDPARRGLEEGVIDSLLSLQPAVVGYLSCNPRALARDLAIFAERGWSVTKIAAYDMFLQTAHLETLVMLEPPSPPAVTRRAPRRRVVARHLRLQVSSRVPSALLAGFLSPRASLRRRTSPWSARRTPASRAEAARLSDRIAQARVEAGVRVTPVSSLPRVSELIRSTTAPPVPRASSWAAPTC